MKTGVILVLGALAPWVTASGRDVAVTVYNQDFAVVKDTRGFAMPKEGGTLTFTDVAARIDPTSVQITNLSNPRFTVREQNFENNLVSADKLLDKMIDQPVTVALEDGRNIDGQLLAAEDTALTLRTADGVKIIERNKNFTQVVLPKLPTGMLLRPALIWKVAGAGGKEEKIEIAYQTAGFNWTADYNVLLRPEGRVLDINGWVTITNASGSSFPDARLKLVAGEVHKVQPEPPRPVPMMARKMAMEAMAPAAPAGFQERAFAEYHLYDLGRRTTLADNETKQIELFDLHDIPYTTEYLFAESQPQFYYQDSPEPETGEDNLQPLKVVAVIENKKENHLGIPLPAGNVRMYQQDTQKTDQFIGQDHIEHTPKDEKVRLTVGQAFDLVGGKRVASSNRPARNTQVQDVVIRLRNHKAQPAAVTVRDNMMTYMNWTIEEPSDPFVKKDYRTIEFKVTVPANGEKSIRYRVRYEMYAW